MNENPAIAFSSFGDDPIAIQPDPLLGFSLMESTGLDGTASQGVELTNSLILYFIPSVLILRSRPFPKRENSTLPSEDIWSGKELDIRSSVRSIFSYHI